MHELRQIADVAVVAIGRNEGERLRACLHSVLDVAALVVYVDSGSSDGSAQRARAHCAEVVELDPARPFSAARARNAAPCCRGACYTDRWSGARPGGRVTVLAPPRSRDTHAHPIG